VDVMAVMGESTVTAIGLVIGRSDTDSRVFPTRGSQWNFEVQRAGAMGGDYNFTSTSAQFVKYWTVDEDYFGRKSVLTFRIQTGLIWENDKAPLFERFYAGGHRSFRGFEYRGVGPRGIVFGSAPPTKGDDPVGGDFLLLTGVEYNYPIYQETLRGVIFIDSGTVQDDIGISEYRVSVGAGIRLRVPFLGQVPFAIDVAFPILKEDGDEEQLFSFDLSAPF